MFQIPKEKQTNAAGSVRVNRFGNPSLTQDKDVLKKDKRDGNVILVKWVDNKTVVLGSKCVGKGELDIVDR
ncbi:hypothetical protein PR048_010783 [Dryococelus australis]|uniref:PiggyBac transposable element-derived protein domain-containing protein n=1 Tax=Dryococelus australis TaxID=614101 RepID=A0ABQ9I3R2_9NEOP|nr:hypothetical protein PR048_010783 [Dryococelus australis]